jgi:hypothetical protein
MTEWDLDMDVLLDHRDEDGDARKVPEGGAWAMLHMPPVLQSLRLTRKVRTIAHPITRLIQQHFRYTYSSLESDRLSCLIRFRNEAMEQNDRKI